MPSPARPVTRHVVAVVIGDDVWTDAEGRLPRVEADWPSIGTLAPERQDIVAMAPRVRVGDEDLHVLTPLSAAGAPLGVRRVPVAELAQPASVQGAIVDAIREWRDPRARPAGREDWYAEGWTDRLTAWLDDALEHRGLTRAGELRILRIWPLSALVACAVSDGADVVVKLSCGHFAAEPALTAVVSALAPAHTPDLLATGVRTTAMRMFQDRGDDDAISPGSPTALVLVRAARAIAELQVASSQARGELTAAGAPDRGMRATRDALARVLREGVEVDLLSDDERESLPRTATRVAESIDALSRTGFPDAVVHGDLHPGNIAHRAADDDSPVIFDWSDAAISHPALDAVFLAAAAPDHPWLVTQLWDAWSDVWLAACPSADTETARAHAAIVMKAYQIVSYEGIFRGLEPGRRAGMGGIQARLIRELIALAD